MVFVTNVTRSRSDNRQFETTLFVIRPKEGLQVRLKDRSAKYFNIVHHLNFHR